MSRIRTSEDRGERDISGKGIRKSKGPKAGREGGNWRPANTSVFREHSLTEDGWGGDLGGQAAESQAAREDSELFPDDMEGRCAGDSLGMMIRGQTEESPVAEVQTEQRNSFLRPELEQQELGWFHGSFVEPLRFHNCILTFVFCSLL